MPKFDKMQAMNARLHRAADTVGNLLVDTFHYIALFAIGGGIVWSALFAFLEMGVKGGPSLDDILLLFIYIELGAMVGIYFKTQHMPVRYLIYIAVTALTRMLVGDISADHEPDMGLIYISVSILLLALANLVVRYSSARFPAPAAPGGKTDARNAPESETD